MASVLLYNRKGKVSATVLVDDEDFADVSLYRWCRHATGYACRTDYSKTPRVTVMMHRFILGPPPTDGVEVDHINRCRTDNRRCNLRWVTRSENIQNGKVRSTSKTGVKYVERVNFGCGPRYRARIEVRGVTIRSPTFKTLGEAVAFRNVNGKGD